MVWSIQAEPQRLALDEIASSSSDRVVAIVGAAMVEHSLRIALELRLRKDRGLIRRVFGPDGFLGPPKAKINLGYLLGIHGKEEHDTLSALFEIRNRFAHKLDMRFDSADQEFRKSVKRLNMNKCFRFYPHPLTKGMTDVLIEAAETNKSVFLINTKILLALLMQYASTYYLRSHASDTMSYTDPAMY